MSEIEKYKKATRIFRVAGLITFPLMFIYYLIIVLSNREEFNAKCAVAVSVFFGTVAIFVMVALIFERKRRYLVDKYFGRVSAEDIEKSKELLSRIKIVVKGGEYSFLGEGKFGTTTLKGYLNQMAKGHKIYKGAAEFYFALRQAIEEAPESERDLTENKEFNAYVRELGELFEKNATSDI